MKPAKWNTGNLMKFTLSIGPISSIFDILTFLLMYFVFHANTIGNQALFHSGWFVIATVAQRVVVVVTGSGEKGPLSQVICPHHPPKFPFCSQSLTQ